ncbi:MAG: hypothetical protein KAQ94_03090 [Arcobacteraceae bacterium]|nr:hypothetical protein [Arcobacteraceae bacterium]
MLKKYLATIFIGLLVTATFAQAAQKPPFLILSGIPHYTGIIQMNWDNKDLALTKEQKVKLLQIRKETMQGIISMKKKIAPFKNKVIEQIEFDSELKEFDTILEQIAAYKVQATKVHLKCVYETKKVLTQEQLDLLITL